MTHLGHAKPEFQARLNLGALRHGFRSSSSFQFRTSPAAYKNSGVLKHKDSTKIDDAYVPFHRAVTDAKLHQRFPPNVKPSYISGASHSEPQIMLHDDIGLQSRQFYRVDDNESRPRNFSPKLAARSTSETINNGRTSTDATAVISQRYTAEPEVDVVKARFRSSKLSSQPQRNSTHPESDFPVNSKNHLPSPNPLRENWQIQKKALREKFGSSAWSPRKRLSPDSLEGIRTLRSQHPDIYTTPVLADHFQVSPEAIRRILKSKWRANEEEEADRQERWNRRGEKIWSQMVEIGVKPPKKWREMGVGKIKKGSHGMEALGKASMSEHVLRSSHARRPPCNTEAVSKEVRVMSSTAHVSERRLSL